MRKKGFISLILVFTLLLAACGGGGSKLADNSGPVVPESEMGEPVPSMSLMTSLPEQNMVNYEMIKEFVGELQKLGIEAESKPTDFAVVIDTIYGDDMDYDAYTIGWSGRLERLDPDMFIHSINHTDNAHPGGNNTNRYSNPEFDAIADAQREEMDIDKRRELVFEAQKILAEDVSQLTLYSRAGVQAYNKEKYSDPVLLIGEGLFNEWTPIRIKPLTDDKTLVVSSDVNLDTLNPLAANSVYEWRNLRLIYDKLARISPEVEPVPSAASKWEIVDDTTIDVDLKTGMKFHDGKPLTVEDVKYTYDIFIENEVPYFWTFLEPIESVEIIGENSVRFTLKRPYASFITNTLTQIPILPKHIWESVDDKISYENKTPIGSGPFVFKNFRPGEELVTVANDDYHEEIFIDGYIFKIFGSPEGALTSLELKDVDMMSADFVPAHIDSVKANEGGKYNHLEMTEVADMGFFYLGFNLLREPFNNKDFRIAMSYLVDYDLAVDVLLNGYGTRGGAGLVIVEANEFWHNPEVPIYNEYNPEKAKEILEKAGFTWDSKGKMHMPKK